jgi:glycosyltransferase involved in cell wall biosynthesis
MNLLFLDQFSEIGGAQRCFLDLLPALQQQSWSVDAALPGEGPFHERLRAAKIPVGTIPCGPYRSGEKTFLDMARLALDLRRQVKLIQQLLTQKKFDWIYVNGPRLMPAAAKMDRGAARVLFHAHNHINQKQSAELLGRCLAESGAQVVACSQFVAQPLESHVEAGNLRVIHNGVPDMRLSKPVGATGPLQIGMIGRIEEAKGQLELLQAAKMLEPIRPHLLICGSAQPSRYADEVRQLGTDLGVDFRGWREDIREILNSLDLLVIASRVEGFPRVMLEAFSAGVAVVAFPAGGIPEAIEDNVTGFLTKDFTAAALAERIRELASDRPRIEMVARNARSLWEQRYDVAIYRSRMMDVLSHPA